MKRHRSLHALSQHHHFALTQALLIRRAAQAPAARRVDALRETAQKFLRFWKKTGQQHFREEEEILLPAYARHARLDRDPAAMRLLAEHAQIRGQIQQLEESLETGGVAEEGVAALARVLHDHIRFEENEFFPRIETALGEAELTALGQRLTRLHSKESCEI
jgi:hemerythrin-like domain-containing protein